MGCSPPGSSVHGIWSGLPFPSPGDLPDPGNEPVLPALVGGSFTTELPGKSPKRSDFSNLCYDTRPKANHLAKPRVSVGAEWLRACTQKKALLYYFINNLPHVFSSNLLNIRISIFPIKGLVVNILGFVGHNSTLLLHSTKAAADNT